MNLSTAKKCNSRDAATATLRKLGIAKADYDDYICRRDGVFYVDVVGVATVNDKAVKEATAALEAENAKLVADRPSRAGSMRFSIEKGIEIVPAKTKAAKVTKVVKPEGAETVSAMSRRLIREGKTNLEVWEAIKPAFNLADGKRGYPSWFRCELRNKGEAV